MIKRGSISQHPRSLETEKEQKGKKKVELEKKMINGRNRYEGYKQKELRKKKDWGDKWENEIKEKRKTELRISKKENMEKEGTDMRVISG